MILDHMIAHIYARKWTLIQCMCCVYCILFYFVPDCARLKKDNQSSIFRFEQHGFSNGPSMCIDTPCRVDLKMRSSYKMYPYTGTMDRMAHSPWYRCYMQRQQWGRSLSDSPMCIDNLIWSENQYFLSLSLFVKVVAFNGLVLFRSKSTSLVDLVAVVNRMWHVYVVSALVFNFIQCAFPHSPILYIDRFSCL